MPGKCPVSNHRQPPGMAHLNRWAKEDAPKMYHVSQDDMRWLDAAVGYDSVSTVGAAYNRLISFRKKIEDGEALRILVESPLDLKTIEDFDAWVRARYPVFIDDPLHPLFVPKP
jgi:hypothetical protein